MTFDELCALAGNSRPLPRSAPSLERITTTGLPGCTVLTGVGPFQGRSRRGKRNPQERVRGRAEKDNDALKSHKYIDQIRVAFGGQFKAVKKAAALYAGGSLRFWTGGIKILELNHLYNMDCVEE